MPKPGCFYSSDLTREISILGAPVTIKNYICARDGGEYRLKPDPPKLQLTIQPTRLCNARCPFCIAAPTDDPARLNPDRLLPTLERLKQADLVRGVTITGGEPCLDMALLDEIIRMCYEVFGPGIQITLDTNGSGLHALKRLRDLYRLDTIHISRHHWDDAVSNRIFGREMPAAAELKEVIRGIACPDLFVLNCLLLRGFVSTPEDARRYMDFAIDTGAGKVAFITPSPVNAWTAERAVPFEDVLRKDDPGLLFTRSYRDFDICRCQDGVYASRGRLIEFYGRQTRQGGCEYCRGLVIDPDGTLRAGFGGAVLARPDQEAKGVSP